MNNLQTSTSIALAISRAKQLNLTQFDIASSLGVSQSQISRIFSGRTSPTSKLAVDLCKYVSSAGLGISRELVSGNDDLMAALSDVWDGSPGHARALAAVIRSLGLLGALPQSTGVNREP